MVLRYVKLTGSQRTAKRSVHFFSHLGNQKSNCQLLIWMPSVSRNMSILSCTVANWTNKCRWKINNTLSQLTNVRLLETIKGQLINFLAYIPVLCIY